MEDKKIPSLDKGFEEVTDVKLDEGFEEIPEKKKSNSQLPSSSVNGTSVSENLPVGGFNPIANERPEPVSIPRIKQNNAKKFDSANASVIKDAIKNSFTTNPNPVYQNSFIDALVKKGYDKDQLTQYANTLKPAEAGEDYKSPTEGMSLSEVFGKNAVSEYIDRSGEGIEAGVKQTGRALGDIAEKIGGIPLAKEKPLTTTVKELGTDVLNAGAGSLKAAFSVGGLVVPQLLAFNTAVESVKALPKEVKEKFILPTPGVSAEEKAKTFDKVVDLPFAAATTFAEELGYTPEEGSAGLATLEILNLLIPLGAAKAKGAVSERIKNIDDLKGISEKISQGKATDAEVADYTEVSNGIKDVSLEEVKAAAEKKLEKIPVKDDELHTELASLQQAHDALPEGEAKSRLFQLIDFKEQEIAEKTKTEVGNDLNEAAKKAESETAINDLDGKIKALETDKEIIDNPIAKKAVDDHINELSATKEGIEKSIEPLKDETISKEPAFNESESFDGKDYSKGKTSETIAKEEGVEFTSPEELQRFVADKSENPLELATEYLKIETELAKDKKSYKDQLLDEAKIELTTDEFKAISDKANTSFTIAKQFLNEDRKVHFDKKLEEIKNETGIEITHDELADYINRAGQSQYIAKDTPIKTKFKNKFADLTGKDLTPKRAKAILENEVKKLNKDYERFINREYGSFAEAERGYYDAIKSGELAIEGGEVVSIVERKQEAAKRTGAGIIADLRARIGAIRNEKDAGRRVEEIERTIKAIDAMLAKSVSNEKPIKDSKKSEKVSEPENEQSATSTTTSNKRDFESSPKGSSEIIQPTQKEGKSLKLGERILDSDEVSSEIKKGLQEKGIDYIPIKLDVTQADAKAYVKSFEEAGEIDRAISNVTNMSNSMSGVNRGAIGKELFETLADKARAAENLTEQKKWQDKAVDIAKFTAENFKNAGQEINAAKAWKRMLERTPEGAIASLKKDYTERNESTLKSHQKEISGAKEIIDEFVKSADFEKLVGEKVKAEFEKLGKKSPKKENIFNSKAVRDVRKEELRKKWAEAKGSASASIIGLNKEQIEVLGEMGVIYLIDGAYQFKGWANKMKKEFNELTEEQLQEIWDKVKVGKEYDERQRTLSEFAKYGVFEKMSPEIKKQFLDKWDKRLQKLKPESRKKLLGNAIEEIEKLGGLTDEHFADMYAKELGLPTIDAAAESKIRSLVETINKSEKSAKELQDLFDKGADKKEIEAKQKEWVADVFKGQKANGELSEYFKNEKRFGVTLSTILQGNLLGTLSIAKNVYSNSLIQPLRFASRGIASGADYIMSKAAGLPLMNKLIGEGRTIDALAYWKGESKGAMPGLKTSVKELIQGINPEEMIERDLSQQLQPLKSIVKFYEGLTGKEKQTAYQQLNNFTEGTFGMPAEVMFRLLNLGDKPFRKAAEFGAAREIGVLKGLKGNELEKFILFPDAKSSELIKERAERSVYQQSEGLAKVAQQGIKSVEKYLADIPYIGDVAQIVFKSQIPYVKTPLNILGETFQYALPEYTSAKAIYHAVKGERRSALENFGKAVTGFAIRAAVQSLVQNNLVTPSADYKDPEGTAIQLQNVPPNSLNITGLQRMMNGGNPATKDNDVWINTNNMGVVGMFIGIHANQKGIEAKGKDYLNDLATTSVYLAQASLEQSFLQGTNSFLGAISGDEKKARKWAINTLGALGAIVYPNTVSNVSKASDDYIRVTKAPGFSDELVNTFKTKMFHGNDLPTKVNLWGAPVKSAPEGRNKYLWYLLDVTKFKDVPTDTYNYKIYDLWNKAEDPKEKRDILPNIPRNYLMHKKQRIDLNPALYEQFQKITGKNRANLIEKYTLSPNWDKDEVEKKIEKLNKLYKSGYDNAKKQLLFEHPELRKVVVK